MTRGAYSRGHGRNSQSIGGRLNTIWSNSAIHRPISEDSETQPPSPTQSPLHNSLPSPLPFEGGSFATGAQQENSIAEVAPNVQPSETSYWRTGGPIHITPRTFQYVYKFHILLINACVVPCRNIGCFYSAYKEVTDCIREVIFGHYNGAWVRFKDVELDIRKFWFRLFKVSRQALGCFCIMHKL